MKKSPVCDPEPAVNIVHNTRYTTGLLMFLLVGLFFFSLMVGRLEIRLSEIWTFVCASLFGTPVPPELSSKALVFTLIRFPRCLLAVFVGMGMSISGAVYQGLFRNPLVSPDILGVSAGCTFGAALGLILPGDSFMLVRVLSFVFGLAAVFLALGIARMIAVSPILVLVLAGLVVTSVFSAFLMILKYVSDPYNDLPAIVFWIMGSLNRVEWNDLYIIMPVIGGGLILIHILRYRLNVLSLGDLQTRSLGMNPTVYRIIFIMVSSLMVAVTVSTCGQVCWIGLVIPHIARTLVGPNHSKMIPVTLLIGGIFMLAADMLARSITAAELPVSIITALTGAPLFVYLLYKNRGSGWI